MVNEPGLRLRLCIALARARCSWRRAKFISSPAHLRHEFARLLELECHWGTQRPPQTARRHCERRAQDHESQFSATSSLDASRRAKFLSRFADVNGIVAGLVELRPGSRTRHHCGLISNSRAKVVYVLFWSDRKRPNSAPQKRLINIPWLLSLSATSSDLT